MRICSSCGRENADDQDFCQCGEYLRWEPTGFMSAITPEAAQAATENAPPANPAPAAPAPTPAPGAPPPPAAAAPPPPSPAAPPPAPAAPPAGNGHGSPLAGAPAPAPTARTAQQPAVPQPPPPQPQQPEEPDHAAISLRLPDDDAPPDGPTQLGIDPGSRQHVLGLVRNQSGIVDNYDLSVRGLPEGWWSIFPSTVYLVPFGTGGTYEQEVQVHLHPPRSADAEAGIYELEVVAQSKAYAREAASAPLILGIQPYEEFKTKVKPERASGRRRAKFGVAVSNTANAPVTVALDATDPDNQFDYRFDPPAFDIEPGQTRESAMEVRPPKQIWVGRPTEHRIEVLTRTGEEAAALEQGRAAAGLDEEDGAGGGGGGKGGLKGVLGKAGIAAPQVSKPNVHLGQGGVRVQKPMVRGPRAPRVPNVNLSSLKVPGRAGGAAPPPSAPLLPSQAVFRQKPWLPWWVAIVLPLLLLLGLMLFLLLPKNVAVPDVVGSKSAFEAETKLSEAGLKLAPTQKEQVTTDAAPGTVVGQTPAAGESAKKDSEVSILVAVGNGKVSVPKIVGLTPPEAEKALRAKKLSLGQAAPQPVDPKAKISSQIPAEGEVVKEGTPIDIFFPKPGPGKDGKKAGGKGGEKKGGGAAGAAGAGAAAGAAVAIPAIAGAKTDAFAQKAADAGLVPETVRQFDASPPGTLFGTDPPAGTELKAGDRLKLLVSAGFPQLAFDDDKNILLVNGATGKKLDPIAKGPSREKDPAWSADGTSVAFVGAGRVFLKNMKKPDAPAQVLTGPDETFSDLAWAPTADLNLLAMSRLKGDDRDLCLGQITKDGMTPRCIAEPGFQVGKSIHWAPDGKAIIGLGVKKGLAGFGIVRWRSKKPFSPDPSDWGKGHFVTDTKTAGKGVLDAAISPDGKRLALVSNLDSDFFRLYLAKPGDFLLTSAKPTPVHACKVAWRLDGKELVVVQADELCQEDVGALVRLPVKDPTQQRQLNAAGDNPVFQPLTLGG